MIINKSSRLDTIKYNTFKIKPIYTIGLIPIGALTANGAKVPHTFRPWEVQSIDSIDLRDSSLASIRYQLRGEQIMRILPRVNDQINGEWATDKGRYAPIDGIHVQEVHHPRMRITNESTQRNSSNNYSWETIDLKTIISQITGIFSRRPFPKIRVIYGGTTDCESIEKMTFWVKAFKATLQSITPIIKNNAIKVFKVDDNTHHYIPTEINIKKVLLVGCDPRIQSPLLNVKLRELYLQGTEFWSIGTYTDLTYPLQHIGLNNLAIPRIHNIKWDFIILGLDAFRRADILDILNKLSTYNPSFKELTIRICNTRANDTFIRNHIDSNTYVPTSASYYDIQIIVNITEKELDAAGFTTQSRLDSSKCNIILTSKGADWRKNADFILPILNHLEYEATYLSMRGFYRKSKVILQNKYRNSISFIFTEFYKRFDKVLVSENVITQNVIQTLRVGKQNLPVSSSMKSASMKPDFRKSILLPRFNSILDYHLEGHPFAEYSATRARCSADFHFKSNNFYLV